MEETSKPPLWAHPLNYTFPFLVVFFFVSDVWSPLTSNGHWGRALCQPLTLLRKEHESLGQDFLIIVLVGLYFTGLSTLKPPDWILETRVVEVQIFSILVMLMIFAGIIVYRGETPPYTEGSDDADGVEENFLPPLLLPGKTSHSRMFPEKHSFDYSYFSVGIPVGWKGCSGSVLSANLDLLKPEERRRGWFNIDASDYLYRGGSERGLEERLQNYLRKEGVPDDAWSFAYLVTAPKFLGYSFNPVSFWYIYDSSQRLAMMVLEVNNTFGERHLYLLKSDGSANGEPAPDGFKKPAKGIKFTNAWAKDFHVSPFNSRKGFYSLTAADPLAAWKNGDKVLDNLLVLKSSKEHAKLVARVFSEGKPKDPSSLSTFELLKLLASWFWVGFLTFPRILTQAYVLYFKRNLHVWYKPEVLISSIGRTHTSTEKTLAKFFREYLASLVENTSSPLRINYIPPGSLGEPITMTSTHTSDAESKEMTLQVLTPSFYSRFAHYAHTSEALDREALCPEPKNRTVAITNPEHLSILLSKPATSSIATLGMFNRWRWTLLTTLRCPPPAVSYPDIKSAVEDSYVISDIRALPPSGLDRFVMARGGVDARVYRRTVTKLFIAQRWFLGFEALVSLLDLAFRVAMVVAWSKIAPEVKGIEKGVQGANVMVKRAGMWVLVNGLHIWALVKGLEGEA